MIGAPLYDVAGAGLISLVTDGPVIGDDEPCIRIAASGYLSTRDLDIHEGGDAEGGAGFSVEFWIRISANPTLNTTLLRGPYAAAATPQWRVTLSNAGVLSIDVYGNNGVYYSAPTQVLTAGVWHHVVGSSDGATYVRLYLDNQLTSGAFSGGFIHGLDPAQVGNLDLYVGGAQGGANFDYAYLGFYGGLVLPTARISEHYRAGTQMGFVQQATGERIGAVLDRVSSQAPRRIGAAVRQTTEEYTAGEAPVDLVRSAVSAEANTAAFFVGSDGGLVFLGANHRASPPYNSAKATFGDGAGELPYLDLTIDYSESFLFNYWSVTRKGTNLAPGAEQISFDQTSIDRFFKRAQLATGIPVVADSDASDIATAQLAKYKDPMQRITGVVFDMTLPDVADAVLGLELMDCIRVLRTPPGGGARIDQTLYVQKIAISGANDGKPWTATIGVSPL